MDEHRSRRDAAAMAALALLGVPLGVWIYGQRTDAAQRRMAESERLRRVDEQALQQRRQQVERQEREAEARRRQADEQRRQSQRSPEEVRAVGIAGQFSPWTGEHRALAEALQQRLHDPASFQHVESAWMDLGAGRGIRVVMRYRARNAFGALVLQRAEADVSESGQVLAIRQP